MFEDAAPRLKCGFIQFNHFVEDLLHLYCDIL